MTHIVITGLGATTSIGNDVESFWTHLTTGVSGAGPLTAFDAADFPVRVACGVKEFAPADFVSRRVARHAAPACASGNHALLLGRYAGEGGSLDA